MSKLQEAIQQVEFIANPTQRLFIESRHQADLFSSRKGEGKSAGLCWAAFYYTQHNPGATGICVRDTYENLKRTTLQEFLHWFPVPYFGEWIAGDKCYVWNTATTGMKGKLYFMGADDENAASKIASMPLAFALLDEPSPAAGDSAGIPEIVFDTIVGQLRQPGMKWYSVKLAQNNPDESHWTHRRFVDPGTPPDEAAKAFRKAGVQLLPDQIAGYKAFQTKEPENLENLPPGYYETLAQQWAHRPDLIRRFVKGKYGYQQVGKAVTPQWNDEIHLAEALAPVKNIPLHILYDGGLNPTAIITQVTPMGFWLILESFVGDGIGMYQLIERELKPALAARYSDHPYEIINIGDPALDTKEQSNSSNSAVRIIKREIGGRWVPGPIDLEAGLDPLQYVLTQLINGVGMVQVDKRRAKEVWYALRGGWHWHIARTGQQGAIKKNMHSHPGDGMRYGAGKLFPLGKIRKKTQTAVKTPGGYYGTAPGSKIDPFDVNLHGDKKRARFLPRAMRRIGN